MDAGFLSDTCLRSFLASRVRKSVHDRPDLEKDRQHPVPSVLLVLYGNGFEEPGCTILYGTLGPGKAGYDELVKRTSFMLAIWRGGSPPSARQS